MIAFVALLTLAGYIFEGARSVGVQMPYVAPRAVAHRAEASEKGLTSIWLAARREKADAAHRSRFNQSVALNDGPAPALPSADRPLRLVPDDFHRSKDGRDDAPSVQRAVDALCRGGGTKLDWLPRHYVIASAIVQECFVIWEGAGWQEAPVDIARARGTWLDIVGTDFAPVTIRGTAAKGSEIRDIAVDQPGQPVPSASAKWAPAPYPYVFNVENVGGYVGFRHIFMDGVTDGIRSFNGGRTVVDGLWGQFFNNDILYDQETDVSRITDVHSWPYWSDNLHVIDFQQAHHQAIILGRVDSPFIDRIFVFAASSGIQIQTGVQGGTTTGAEVGMISCDSVVACVQNEGIGADMFIGEMRQFGQKELSSAVPYPGATALLIEGQGRFRIGLLSAKMIDAAPIVAANHDACSTVLVSQLDVDFSFSRRKSVSLLEATRCSKTSLPATQIILGVPPQIVMSGAQTLQSPPTGRVSWPNSVAH